MKRIRAGVLTVALMGLLAWTGIRVYVSARLKDAIEFAAGDNVETGAGLGEECENGQRRVRLYGITDGVRQGSKGLCVRRIVLEDRTAGINVCRSSNVMRKVGQRDLLTVIVVLGIGEHFRLVLGLNFQYGTGG